MHNSPAGDRTRAPILQRVQRRIRVERTVLADVVAVGARVALVRQSAVRGARVQAAPVLRRVRAVEAAAQVPPHAQRAVVRRPAANTRPLVRRTAMNKCMSEIELVSF